jgi:hypothetical protein
VADAVPLRGGGAVLQARAVEPGRGEQLEPCEPYSTPIPDLPGLAGAAHAAGEDVVELAAVRA